MRTALFRSTLVLAVASIASGAPLLWLYPEQGRALVAMGVVEAAVWGAIAVVTRRVARRYLAGLAAFCAFLVMPGPLLTIATLPAQYATTLAYLAAIPLVVALFIPWGARAHALWLAGYVGIGTAFALSPVSAALSAEQRYGLALALCATAVVSFVGHHLLNGTRDREFSTYLRLRSLNERGRVQQAELADLNRMLAESARVDPLTGLYNRLRLAEDLGVLWGRHIRYAHRYAALMLDLDHFKMLNDRYGHLAGDATLQAVAGVLRNQTRPGDVLYRFGGEEFLVILPDAGPAAARDAAERLRQAVVELAIPHPDNQPWGVVTISAGFANVSSALDPTVDDWLRRADGALYEAKAAGRNRVDGTLDPLDAEEAS